MKFEQISLSEVCDLIAGFAFKSKHFGNYRDKVIKIANITPPSVSMSDLVGVDISYYNSSKLERFTANVGDYVLAMTGATIGKIGRIEFGQAYINQCVLLFRNHEEKIDKDFLYYVLQQYEFEQYVKGHIDSESAQPNISAGTIGKYQFCLPSMDLQKRIGRTLRMFDEKIELNSQINENLQQQSQAIYSSMFIDNPDPAWSHGHLSDLITVKYGKDHKKLADGIYPVYGSGGIMRYVERPLYNKESVLIPRKGTLNNVMYVNQPFWSVDTMFYTEMKLPNVAKFVYHFVKAKDLASMNAGSAVPSMTTDILNAMEVVIPSASALEEFESLVAPMYEAMEANDVQSKALSQMRDTLLPKLMSGEIDVSDIQL